MSPSRAFQSVSAFGVREPTDLAGLSRYQSPIAKRKTLNATQPSNIAKRALGELASRHEGRLRAARAARVVWGGGGDPHKFDLGIRDLESLTSQENLVLIWRRQSR
jgi:hypothetical protein